VPCVLHNQGEHRVEEAPLYHHLPFGVVAAQWDGKSVPCLNVPSQGALVVRGVPSDHLQTMLEPRRSGHDVAAGPVEATGGCLVSRISVAVDHELVCAAHLGARLAPHRMVGQAGVCRVQRRSGPCVVPCVLHNQGEHRVEEAPLYHHLPFGVVAAQWDGKSVPGLNVPGQGAVVVR